MMKIQFKKIFFTLSVLLLAVIMIPAIVFAAQNDKDNNKDKGFCAKIDSSAAKIVQELTNKQSKIDAAISAREKKDADRWSQRDENRKNNRAKWDADMDAQFAKLESRATTDAQKKAVTDFKSAVLAAISVRRAAIDSAVADFRKAVEDATNSRKDSINIIRNAFTAATDAAVEKAKADCAAGIDESTVRSNLQAALKAAKDKFAADKAALDKIKADITPAIAARKAAFEKAQADFKAAVEKAKADLKAAWSQA